MISQIEWHYVARQVETYNSQTTDQGKNDCLYRIASHADVLSFEELSRIDTTGMTQAFKNKIFNWVKENRSHIEQAIAEQVELKAIAYLASVKREILVLVEIEANSKEEEIAKYQNGDWADKESVDDSSDLGKPSASLISDN